MGALVYNMRNLGVICGMVANMIAVMACLVGIFLVVLDINRPVTERTYYNGNIASSH